MKTLTMSKKDKRGVNVYLTVKLVDEARELGINLSATLDQMLSDAIREKKREQWKAENKSGIQALNEFEQEMGLFTDDDEYGVI
ncbi:type II toxin-antitoxin system CcdA family antitoxin [Proteus terrae]|uniref:type II toxin-antitoxin system CcdA family antitoxin n=1 Tax=Proteus terrae TaxID=1574161 RepID=UPI002094B253|nr:type II toxin-antitoxin system CcdA family antitoxin [Proteus terrae]MCO7049339.1 type II toxin-antitoxin system CcdA family antitoxin [Proteus terrae]